MNRQRKILIGLITALLFAVVSAWLRMPTQQRVAATATLPRTNAAASPASARVDVGSRLQVELLDRPAQRFRPPNRDLFNFVEPPPPQPKKMPDAVAPPPPPPPPAPAPETMRRIEVRRALARFTFLGYLLKDQRRTVFLSQGESLFLVQEGDRFGDNGMFHAVSITPEKMTISQDDNPGMIEIQLVEKAPLVPTFDEPGPPPVGTSASGPGGGVPLSPSLPVPPPAYTPGGRRTFNAGPKGESTP